MQGSACWVLGMGKRPMGRRCAPPRMGWGERTVGSDGQDGYHGKNSQRERQHSGGGGQISACHADAPFGSDGRMFYFYKRMTAPFCDSPGKKNFSLCRQAGNPPNDTIKMHKK